jgi:SAM-dependent methyltransferase
VTTTIAPQCRLCGSREHVLVSRNVSEAPDAGVYSCADCGIVYVFPIMTEAEEAAFYAREFEEYMSRRSGPGWKSPEAHFASYRREEGERRLPLVRPHLRQDDAVLEIGASTGYFLDVLRPHVGSVAAVEPSDAYREHAIARGIESVARLEDLGTRRFDAIALYYVLEHLRDPIGYVQALAARLNPGGRLLIEVPNVGDALLSVYKLAAFDRFYWQRAHYHNFSKQTLTGVLERAGYTVQTYPVQRYDLSNHMVWMMEGRPGGHGRFADVLGAAATAEYSQALKNRWICDTVFAVATSA